MLPIEPGRGLTLTYATDCRRNARSRLWIVTWPISNCISLQSNMNEPNDP
jgi:hypothetical protein